MAGLGMDGGGLADMQQRMQREVGVTCHVATFNHVMTHYKDLIILFLNLQLNRRAVVVSQASFRGFLKLLCFPNSLLFV